MIELPPKLMEQISRLRRILERWVEERDEGLSDAEFVRAVVERHRRHVRGLVGESGQ
jgi:hypothetical protein